MYDEILRTNLLLSGLLETTSLLDRETQAIYEAFVEVKDLSGQVSISCYYLILSLE